MKKHFFSIMILFFSISVMCHAQKSLNSIDSVADFQAIPTDVAFDLLGINAGLIQQPGTISKFLLSIQPVVNSGGNLSPGLALSISPYQMIMGKHLQLKDYINNYGVRILSNIQIGLGTAPSKNADSSQDWGIGIRINLLNSGDGRVDTAVIRDLINRSLEIFDAVPLPEPGDSVTAEFMKLAEKAGSVLVELNNLIPEEGRELDQDLFRVYLTTLDSIVLRLKAANYGRQASLLNSKAESLKEYSAGYEIYSSLKEENTDPSWNAAALDINGGAVYTAGNGNITESSFNRFRIWLNGGFGFGSSQLLLQAGFYRQQQTLFQTDSSSITEAIMFRYGGSDIRFGIGATGNAFKSGVFNLVSEIRIGDRAWIVASFNREVAEGIKPSWKPAISLKFTGGAFGF